MLAVCGFSEPTVRLAGGFIRLNVRNLRLIENRKPFPGAMEAYSAKISKDNNY
ncbi:hypothetical protein ACO2Q8_03165 [Larkinella sp. VNQ87]|uniref:hypothetical protein n=1 Tax=Larkinella sp. VNQ87 TaxID=3400921 RepID=UPI003BFF6952